MTSGRRGGSSASTICRSVRQTPHARTRSRTCPDRAVGRGLSKIFSGRVKILAGELSTAAFIEVLTQHNRRASRRALGRTAWDLLDSHRPLTVGPRGGMESELATHLQAITYEKSHADGVRKIPCGTLCA